MVVLTDPVECGQVTPVGDRTSPLEDAVAVVRHKLDGKARGKVVVSVLPSATQTSSPRSTQ